MCKKKIDLLMLFRACDYLYMKSKSKISVSAHLIRHLSPNLLLSLTDLAYQRAIS